MNYSTFQKKLLAWYGKNARELPWRESKDPYRIWVSEIMLQQTQVDTVIPYYKKWLKSFPTLEKLAAAPEDRVMEHWAGLGYYRRARMLHQGARYVRDELGGKIPRTPEDLMKIPGIGKYTAGAIASIAFEAKAPILDGNVIRILTRLNAIEDDTALGSTLKKLWQIAEEALPAKNRGDFNQAMMELGATVCLPQNPQCGKCPVSELCQAHAQGREKDFPLKSNRIKLEAIRNYALVLSRKGRFLFQRQHSHERWGGLWMLPFWENKKSMLAAAGKIKPVKFMTLQHGYTRYKITLNVYKYDCGQNEKVLAVRDKEILWATPKEIEKLPLPSPHKRITRELMRHA